MDEKDGYYVNLEGRIQKAFKASYPPGNAEEDWKIINNLSKEINSKVLFSSIESLEKSLINYLNLFYDKNSSKNFSEKKIDFIKEDIKVDNLDYYYSNSIARASKTMFLCRNEKNKIKTNGTNI